MVCITSKVTTTQKIIFVLKRKAGTIPILCFPLFPYIIFFTKNPKENYGNQEMVKERLVIYYIIKQMKRTKNEVYHFFLD
jgi:hypothetical protein